VKLPMILRWAAISSIVFWAFADSGNAAHLVQNVGDFAAEAARGLSNFVTGI
jgi:hypothetical protein